MSSEYYGENIFYFNRATSLKFIFVFVVMEYNALNVKRYSSEWWFNILIYVVWGRVLLSFVRPVLNMLPVIRNFTDFLMPLFIIVPLLFSLPYILKKLKIFDYLFYIIILFIYFLNFALYPENTELLTDRAYPFLCLTLPVYFVGRLTNLESVEKKLGTISYFVIYIFALYYLFYIGGVAKDDSDMDYNMGASYNILPHVILALWQTMKRASLFKIITSLLGVMMIFSFGTRGPLVCTISFILIYVLFIGKFRHPMLLKTIIASIGVLFLTILNPIMLGIQYLLTSVGMSTRITDFYFESTLDESLGRDYIHDILYNVMRGENYFFGHGILSSYNYVDTYPHNLYLELVFSFGYIPGFLLFFLLTTIFIVAYRKFNNTDIRSFLCVLMCASVIKLFMSGSFIYEYLLFFLIGYCVNLNQRKKCEVSL